MINIQQTGIKTQGASLQNVSKDMYIGKNIRDVFQQRKTSVNRFPEASVKTRSTPIKYDKVKAGATGRFFKYYPINSKETEYKS